MRAVLFRTPGGSAVLRRCRLLFLPALLALVLPAFAGAAAEQDLKEGILLQQKKEHARALEVLQKIEKEHPGSNVRGEALFLQGIALQSLRRWAEAAAAFSKAAEAHPGLQDYAFFFQAEALRNCGEDLKALEALQRLAAEQPGSLLVSAAQLKMAEIHLQRGGARRSVEICEHLLAAGARPETAAQALLLLGRGREETGREEDAVRAYEELWLKYPLNPSAAEAQTRVDRLRKEKKIPPEKIPSEALWRRAFLIYQARLFDRALRAMESIEDFPARDYPSGYAGESWVDELYFHRGMCLLRLKRELAAVERFDLVLRRSRSEEVAGRALLGKMRALVRLGRSEEALNELARYRAVRPQAPHLDQAVHLKARIFEERKDLSAAVACYQAMAEEFPLSPLRFDAWWRAGWLLFKTRDLAGAVKKWNRLQALNPRSFWLEKVLYWKGRTLREMGQGQEAEENFGRLLKDFPASYYHLWGAGAERSWPIGRGFNAPLQEPALPAFWAWNEPPAGSPGWHAEKGKLLARLGLLSAAVEEMAAVEEGGKGTEKILFEVSRLYRLAGEYHRSALLVRRNFSLPPLVPGAAERERSLQLLAYPLGEALGVNHRAREHDLDPALLSALILEESRFNPQALSVAGARGLMQMMPGTGEGVARRLKIKPFSPALLFEPETNLRLGCWYFSSLLEEFSGKAPLALAAYNAGPHRVRQWTAQAPRLREDEFVESIPFEETRNYVIRVLGSARVYRLLYDPSFAPAVR